MSSPDPATSGPAAVGGPGAVGGPVDPPGDAPGPRGTWLERTPLHIKLVLVLVVLSGLVLALSAAIATAALRGFLHAQLDDRLESAFSEVANQAGRGQVFSPPGFFVDALDESGASVVSRQGPLPEDIPVLPDLSVNGVAARDGDPFTVASSSRGADWRVLARRIDPDGPGSELTIVVASSRADADQTVGRLVGLQAGIGALALLSLGLVGSYVIRRSLRPLEEIESVAGDIAAGDLTRRVPDPDERTEVGRLAGALNGMLVRIESAVRDREAAATTANQSEQRMRRFVADASHELRTPLTSIRGFAELYRQGAVPAGPDVGRVMGRIESEAGRMNTLVEDMLLLARLDERRPLQTAPVDLLPLAVDAVYDARAVAPDRVITLVTGDGPEPIVNGDEGRLRQVLANLVTNALTHTPAGSPVEVRVRTDGSSVVLEVADRGPGLDAEQSAKVFERFYRADAARTRSAGAQPDVHADPTLRPAAGGSGLGLSIVAAITAAHGGEVSVESAPGEGATFRVVLPRTAAGSGLVSSPQPTPR